MDVVKVLLTFELCRLLYIFGKQHIPKKKYAKREFLLNPKLCADIEAKNISIKTITW